MTTIVLAQSVAVKGDVGANLRSHIRLIRAARSHHASMVVFPELSVTGYEPDLAHSLAFREGDPRLQPLLDACAEMGVIAVVGAPLRRTQGLHIAEFLIFPDRRVLVYTKLYLHKGEEKYFSPCDHNPVMDLQGERVSLAICADTSDPRHPQRAADNGSSVYVASVLVTPVGYANDASLLCGYASQHNMTVLMVNHGGDSGGYRSAGKSAVWNSQGEMAAQLPGTGEGLLVARKVEGKWEAFPLPLE